MADDDEDVVLEGSTLHKHLVNHGYEDNLETLSPSASKPDDCLHTQLAMMEANMELEASNPVAGRSPGGSQPLETNKRLSNMIWPDTSDKKLEVDLAQHILRSELLVSEDEDFIQNFILTEDTLAEYQEEGDTKTSILKEVLLFSGSIAAVAGAVFFLSEKTRMTATAAAILPSALAAVSSVRIGTKVKNNQEANHFQDMIKQMLCDMKMFKQLLRKSLSLIQGMEMMNQGYMYAVNRQSSGPGPSSIEESQLSKALCKRSSFIALRRAIYTNTVQLIVVYRQAIKTLMDVSPLAEHIDLQDHYLAFIELENFGVGLEVPDEMLSCRQLKDTIQLTLLQQSEYLRRFSLTFCDKVREDNKLDKSGLLKHVKELITKIRKVTDKLVKVFEYHQALGLVPLPELEQRALSWRKQQSLDEIQSLLPLRGVYTTLFSTGLHLQNSLLKIRHLEGVFDILEKRKNESGSSASLIPNDAQLLEWLKGFSEIQSELNACLTCLDDGVTQIDDITQPKSSKDHSEDSEMSATESTADITDNIRVIGDAEQSHMDEVFEAFIALDSKSDETMGFDDDFVTKEEKGKQRAENKQSKKVLQELKTVLVIKKQEMDVRESKAIARQARVDSIDADNLEDNPNSDTDLSDRKDLLSVPKSLVQTNILGLSQETDSDADSIDSDTNTVKSFDNSSHSHRSLSSHSHRSLDTSSAPDDLLILGLKLGQDGDVESIDGVDGAMTHSSSSESVLSDCEVDKSHKIYLHGHNTGTFLPSLPLVPLSQSVDNVQTQERPRKGMAELRSLSTPDLKRFLTTDITSPYVSLERLPEENEEKIKVPEKEEIDSSESDSSSGPELGCPIRHFRRPLRPAALKAKARLRSSSIAVDKKVHCYSEGSGSNGYQSQYLAKKKDSDVQLNSQPVGFDGRLAAAAVAKSRQMRLGGTATFSTAGEEYFGSSESETDDS